MLILAWVFNTPPGSAPDERDHYLRAAGAGRGQFVLSEPPAQDVSRLEVDERWQLAQSGLVTLPRFLSPEVFECRSARGRLTDCGVQAAESTEPVKFVTYVGTYPPFMYVLPGIAMRLGRDPFSALRLGRIAFALISVVFIGFAVSAADGTGRWTSLAGLIAVITPMVLYTASTLSPSGPEAAAAICFLSCALRVARRDPAPRWVWRILGLSALAMAVARDLGPLWVVLGSLVIIGFVGAGETAARVKAGGRPAMTALAMAGLGLVGSLIWQFAVQVHPAIDPGRFRASLRFDFGVIQAVYFQVVGVFGVLDTPMPLWGYAGWALLLASLTTIAAWLGTRRQLVVLLLVAIVATGLTAGLDAVQQAVGFGVQGRHVLPLAIAFGLLAGDTIRSGLEKVDAGIFRGLPVFFLSLAAVVHALAWYSASRRYAVGIEGPVMFLASARWSPPLGWGTWGAVMAGGAGALVWGLTKLTPPLD